MQIHHFQAKIFYQSFASDRMHVIQQRRIVYQKCSVHFVLKACSMNPSNDIIHFLHLLGHQNTAILKVLSTQTRGHSNEK
jgi:hypothetical protein